MKNNIYFENMAFETAILPNERKNSLAKTTFYGDVCKTYMKLNKTNAKIYNRREGEYITYTANSKKVQNRKFDKNLEKYMAKDICKLAKAQANFLSSILIVGLGNSYMTADSLGSLVLKDINIKNSSYKLMGFSPSVSGLTGIESADIVKGIVKQIKPSLVIIVDSLATSKTERLCSSFQISTSGIIPGGGVGNARELLSKDTLKVPVIVIGVPLVFNLRTHYTNSLIELYNDLELDLNAEQIHNFVFKKLNHKNLYCMQDIDVYVEKVAKIIANAINLAFI